MQLRYRDATRESVKLNLNLAPFLPRGGEASLHHNTSKTKKQINNRPKQTNKFFFSRIILDNESEIIKICRDLEKKKKEIRFFECFPSREKRNERRRKGEDWWRKRTKRARSSSEAKAKSYVSWRVVAVLPRLDDNYHVYCALYGR